MKALLVISFYLGIVAGIQPVPPPQPGFITPGNPGTRNTSKAHLSPIFLTSLYPNQSSLASQYFVQGLTEPQGASLRLRKISLKVPTPSRRRSPQVNHSLTSLLISRDGGKSPKLSLTSIDLTADGTVGSADSLELVLPTPPALSCLIPSVTLTVSHPAYAGPATYAWHRDGSAIGTTATLTEITVPGSYAVTVTRQDNGCTVVGSVVVTEDRSTIGALAGADQTLICQGPGTILNGNFSTSLNGSTGRWLGPEGNVISDSRQVIVREDGNYVFEAIHPVSGCSNFDTVQVINEGPSGVAYTLQQAPCAAVGGRLFVREITGNNGPFMISSPTGITETFSRSLRGLPEGENILIVTDQLGCTLRDTFQVFAFGEFTGIAPEVVVKLGEQAVLGIETNRDTGALSGWEWENLQDSLACTACPAPVVRPLESFVATVAVTDTNGCTLNLRQNVLVTEQVLIYLPTAFSPNNGDGINDIYTVFGDAEFVREVNSFGVFNRWGDQVFANNNFSVNDPNAGWDGMVGAQRAPAAVYVYSVTYTLWDGRERTLRGSFALVE